ncbi:MAG TPA: PKD domain-containing protein [Gaiellales bacterium]|nr:PKD domain-containing protein [Gaiellales bacterium]
MRLRTLLVATALLALSPASAWASGGVWTPVRVAPAVTKGSADLPRLALESDGTAVAAWTENGTVRAATRAPGKTFGLQRAIAMSSTLAVPDDAVALGTRALLLLHAQQGTGATLVASSVTGSSVGPPEQAAATTAPITEAAGALRSDGSALAVYAAASAPMTLSSAARSAAGGWSPAGDIALPASVTLVQQLQLALLPDGSAVALFLGQGPAAGDVPRPYAALRSAAGAWAAPVALDPAAVVACADLGLAIDGTGNAYAVWSVSDGRVRTSMLPLGGAFSAAQTSATAARTPRVAGAGGGSVLLAWLDISGAPVLRTAEWTPAGLAAAASTILPTSATTLEDLALAPSTAASAIVTETTGTGAAQRAGTDVLERPAAAMPWTVQNVRTGLAEPVGSPRLAMGALGALALWVEGNVIVASGTDHGLPRIDALAKPLKIGIGVTGPFSLRASDTWSPIVDVTWRYGDGTTEHGTSVRHAYLRAGTFHVTVLVHDATGNAAQRAFIVTTLPIARPLSARATTRGLTVALACLPSNPSVTGTVAAAIPGAKAVPFRCKVGGQGSALVPGAVKRGRRVVVRVTGIDLGGLPHVSAVTLPVR